MLMWERDLSRLIIADPIVIEDVVFLAAPLRRPGTPGGYLGTFQKPATKLIVSRYGLVYLFWRSLILQ